MPPEPRLFLSAAELTELTGWRRHSKQAQWLRDNGIPFRLNAKSRPVVTVAAVTGQPAPPAIITPWEPQHGPQTLQTHQPAQRATRPAAR